MKAQPPKEGGVYSKLEDTEEHVSYLTRINEVVTYLMSKILLGMYLPLDW